MDEAGGAGEASDGELAVRVAAGADAAGSEAELCRPLAPRVRLYGLRHLRDPALADDLVQEVLLLMLERLRAGRVREPERLASFVLGAWRLVVRKQRRRARPGTSPENVRTVRHRAFGRLRDCVKGGDA